MCIRDSDSGEQVPAADRRCASDDSLRAAEIASEIAGEVELDQLTGMLALAVEVSDRRTVQGWMRLLRVVERIPRDDLYWDCLLYTSPSPRDRTRSRMPSSA